MLRRGVIHTVRLVALLLCPLSVRCTMRGCTGGVSVYLPILPYCYNVFLRVHFSKSVRVREWGCLCLLCLHRVVGFSFKCRPACVGAACRRGFCILFSPRRSWSPGRGPTYVWWGGVHFLSTLCGLLLGRWCARCVPLCPPILCIGFVLSIGGVCFVSSYRGVLLGTWCVHILYILSLRRSYTLQVGMLRMLL